MCNKNDSCLRQTATISAQALATYGYCVLPRVVCLISAIESPGDEFQFIELKAPLMWVRWWWLWVGGDFKSVILKFSIHHRRRSTRAEYVYLPGFCCAISSAFRNKGITELIIKKRIPAFDSSWSRGRKSLPGIHQRGTQLHWINENESFPVKCAPN